MEEEEYQELNLIDREQLELKGVIEVMNYDEEEINLKTNRGKMLIGGEGLHIQHLDIEKLQLQVSGKINKLVYDPGSRVKGFFRRLFK